MLLRTDSSFAASAPAGKNGGSRKSSGIPAIPILIVISLPLAVSSGFSAERFHYALGKNECAVRSGVWQKQGEITVFIVTKVIERAFHQCKSLISRVGVFHVERLFDCDRSLPGRFHFRK